MTFGIEYPPPALSPEELAAWVDGYLTGHARGRRDGFEEYDQVLVDGLVQMLGGEAVETYGQAVAAHEKSLRAKAIRDTARREADERARLVEGTEGAAA